jgi:ribonuclease Z
MKVTTLGTGWPLPSADRAGAARLVEAAGQHFLVDCGRGVLMRLASAGLGVGQMAAVFLTHLHSDHVVDFNDVVTTSWIGSFTPTPLRVVAAPTDHRPVHPTVGYRFEHDGSAVVCAGDTVPCEGLDRLCAGADVYVQTVLRRSAVEAIPAPRLQDILDYHSDLAQAGQTATRGGVATLVLTHLIPPPPPGTEPEWVAEVAEHFDGTIVVADDLTAVQVGETA